VVHNIALRSKPDDDGLEKMIEIMECPKFGWFFLLQVYGFRRLVGFFFVDCDME
jgi:hypothetical protein